MNGGFRALQLREVNVSSYMRSIAHMVAMPPRAEGNAVTCAGQHQLAALLHVLHKNVLSYLVLCCRAGENMASYFIFRVCSL